MIHIRKEKVLIKPEDIKPSSNKFEILGTINPAATRLPNGNILLFIRVIEKLKKNDSNRYRYSPRFGGENKFKIKIDKFKKSEIVHQSDLDFSFKDETKRLTFISHFRKVILDPSGFFLLEIDNKPTFYGIKSDGEFGVEDPRITKIGKTYYMTYVTLSKQGNVSTNLAFSKDCEKWERKGTIFSTQNKDVVLFPEKINNYFFAFNRPEGNFQFSKPNIWLAASTNISYWGKNKPFILTKKIRWDSGRVGAGPPPIKTKEGWLFIYHGVVEEKIKDRSIISYIEEVLGLDSSKIRDTYCAGAVLLDLKNPRKIIAKSHNPLLYPQKRSEKGTFEHKDVVFPTGIVIDRQEEDILLYSGGGDVVTTVRKILISEIFKKLEKPN